MVKSPCPESTGVGNFPAPKVPGARVTPALSLDQTGVSNGYWEVPFPPTFLPQSLVSYLPEATEPKILPDLTLMLAEMLAFWGGKKAH